MGYKQAFCILGLWLWATSVSAQDRDFIFPLDTGIYLSGTFGEFRGSHFHAGIDIRTFGKEGLPVRCAADGYVSRIKISPYGYGKAIYVTHPNGYTTVYGHLSRFPENLLVYIRKHQYSKRSFSVELLPTKNQFKFKKGDIIAYSGNSGGSYAPHLHFEIRDTETGEILNPLLFNIGIRDTVAPRIISAFFVNRDRSFKFLTGEYPEEARVDFGNDSIETCYLNPGDKALIVAARDFINEDTGSILGNYQVEVFLGEKEVYNRIFNRFNFSDARFIQMLSGYREDLPPVEYCYKEQWNNIKLCNYENSGWITVNFNKNEGQLILIKVTDEAGNVSKKYIRILENKAWFLPVYPVWQAAVNQKKQVVFENAYTFVFNDLVLVDFSKSTFSDSLEVCINLEGDGTNSKLRIFPETAKTNERFRISLPLPPEWQSQESKVCIFRQTDNKPEYLGGTVGDGKVQTFSKHFGSFGLKLDNQAPEISLYEIEGKFIYLQVTDDFSGIKNITAKIDNSWYLLEYDPKTDMLIGELDQFKSGQEVNLTIVATDNKDNTGTFSHSFKIP